MNYPEVSPKTIWNFRQNNPNLIVEDARKYLKLNTGQCELLRKILLARGVNKWFKVRRDLIAYKKQVKHTLKDIHRQRMDGRKELKETEKYLMQVRATLRKLCKTDRWQIWPQLYSHHKELRNMNSLRASD